MMGWDGEQQHQLEQFVGAVVEEFLMRKNMTRTLEAFREEMGQMGQEPRVLSWYEITERLHMFGSQAKARVDKSVLENCLMELLEESSIRLRVPKSVSIRNLTAAQTTSTQRPPKLMEDISSAIMSDSPERQQQQAFSQPSMSPAYPKLAPKRKQHRSKGKDNNAVGKGKSTSAENWIPEQARSKMINRSLQVAKHNLEQTMRLNKDIERESRRFDVDELDRAHMEESLGSHHKIECALCHQSYSYVNLPLKVSFKAIFDLQKQWEIAAGNSSKQLQSTLFPRCYDYARICYFCAQFFDDQEKYRPSAEQLRLEAKQERLEAAKKRAKEYWDPLFMLEKDREDERLHLKS